MNGKKERVNGGTHTHTRSGCQLNQWFKHTQKTEVWSILREKRERKEIWQSFLDDNLHLK